MGELSTTGTKEIADGRILQASEAGVARITFNKPERMVATCYASDDYAEGRRAFAEKRPPVFSDR